VGKDTSQVREKKRGGGLHELGWAKRSPGLTTNRCSKRTGEHAGKLGGRNCLARSSQQLTYVPDVLFPEGKEDFRKRSIQSN